jgi:hypothetical protein
VSAPGGSGPGAFSAGYASALRAHLRDENERSLRAAYELGREAVGRQLSVLDLAVLHQEALLSALDAEADAGTARDLTRAGGDFFVESLASFEMVQRGFREARETAAAERRQTELSRQLSSFLADASLALDASDSLEEMLRLVAEQARELVGAECCLATVTVGGRPRSAEATSHAGDDKRWNGFVKWLDLFAIYRLLRSGGGSARVAGEQLGGLEQLRSAASDRPLRGWLAASLTTLDGGELGAIQLFDKEDSGFTREDEAAIVYLAQMASAAVERALLYRERS